MSKLIEVKPKSVTNTLTRSHIYASLKPIYTVCKCLGLHSLSLNEHVQLKTGHDQLYFVFFLISTSALSGLSLWSVISEDENDPSFLVVTKFMSVTESAVMAALMLIVLIFTFIFRKTQNSALEMLSHLDATFAQNGYSIPYKRLLKNNYFILIVMTLSTAMRCITMFLTGYKAFLRKITLVVAVMIKALSKYQFVACVLQLQVRFAKINTTIRTFYKKPPKNRLLLDPKMEKSVPDQLYILCRLHCKLASVAQKINSAFSFQLLFSLAVSLGQLLFQSYCLYYVSAGKAPVLSIALIAIPVVWLVDEILEIYWPVYACASTCEQANETPTILHELRNSSFDLQLEDHIQTYSLQMLHQKLQFSVLGFFVMDYTLIYSIVGGVTTYLVIFIQFDQSSSVGVDYDNSTSV